MGRRDSLLTDDVEFLGNFQVAPGLEGESWIGMKSGGVRVGGETWNRDGERIREMVGRSGTKRERGRQRRGERGGEGRGEAGRERECGCSRDRTGKGRERDGERCRETGGKGGRGQGEENVRKKRERGRGTESQSHMGIRGQSRAGTDCCAQRQDGRPEEGCTRTSTGSSHIPDPGGPTPSGVPGPGGWPTWLVSDHLEHSGLALVPDGLQRDSGYHGGGGPRRAPGIPQRPARCSPRPGGSSWAASAPAGRSAPRAGSPWGTGLRAACGSPGHVPAGSDIGGPGGGAGGVSPGRGRGPSTSLTSSLAGRTSVVDTHCLFGPTA